MCAVFCPRLGSWPGGNNRSYGIWYDSRADGADIAGRNTVVTAQSGWYLLFVVRYRTLYAAEQSVTSDVRFPGAWRTRSTAPGFSCSKPEGALYQGSWRGAIGSESTAPSVRVGARLRRHQLVSASNAERRAGILGRFCGRISEWVLCAIPK